MNSDSLSDTEKLNNNETGSELNALYDALAKGDTDSITRLMADEGAKTPEEEPQKLEETPEKKEPEKEEKTPDSTETVETKDKKEENKDAVPSSSETKPEAAPSAASPDDAVDEVTQLKSQIEELKQQAHRMQSDAGRVPYLQRRLAELEKQARSSNRPVTKVDTKTNFTAEDYKNVELDPDTQREIDELKDVDPVMAKVVERTTKTAILTAQKRMEAVLQERETTQTEVDNELFYVEQKAELARLVPEHEKIFQSREWQEWKASLTPGQRALAESGYASEVTQAIYAFAAAMKERFPQKETKASEQAVATETPPEQPQKSEVALERTRKAQAAPEVKGPTAKPSETFDPDAYFKEMYSQIGKESHILK